MQNKIKCLPFFTPLKQLSISDDIIKPSFLTPPLKHPPYIYTHFSSSNGLQIDKKYTILQSKMGCEHYLKNMNLHTTHTFQYAKLILGVSQTSPTPPNSLARLTLTHFSRIISPLLLLLTLTLRMNWDPPEAVLFPDSQHSSSISSDTAAHHSFRRSRASTGTHQTH